MAETTETPDVGVSDSELFQNATAPEPKPETPPPHPEDEGRDIHGRFRQTQAPKPPGEPPAPPPPAATPTPPGQPAPQPPPGTPTPPAAPQTTPQDDANVPSWRLREEREQRERVEQQLRQMQQQMAEFQRQQAPPPPEELPDPLIDPQGYRKALEGKFQSDLRTVQLENNLQLNRLQHGPVFDDAYQAFMQAAQGDQGFARLIVNSPNPGGAMVNWYKRAVTLAKVGDDPEAYVNSEIEKRFADPQFVAALLEKARAIASGQPLPAPQGNGAAPPRQNNVVQIPPSLARVPSGSPTDVTSAITGLDDETLFKESLPPNRHRR